MEHHLIIGGTGRAGTSLLVKYLTECGLETHISRNEKAYWDENAMAGLEDLPLAGSDSPYVVKTPWLFECVDDLVKRKDIAIDAVIIPVRDLVEAVASRSILELKARHADAEYIDQTRLGALGDNARGNSLFGSKSNRPVANFSRRIP